MKNKNLEFKNIVNQKSFNFSKSENLKKNYSIVLKEIIKKLDYPDNIFFSLSKKFIFNFELKNLTKYKKYKKIVIIGMGGSVLGSEAIYCFFKDKIKKNFSFINNIDNEKLKEFDFNKNSNKTLFIVISKSGNTIETLSNFFSLKILKNKAKNLIFISEKGNNFLNILTKNKGLNFIEHRKYIGGRYSVLSEVGMLPAYLMNLKINKFRKNLLSSFQNKNKIFLKKSSIMMANFLIKKKIKNLIFLNYSPKLDKFLYWYQQLLAESLGKKGKGFLPTISTTPKDHHSLLQLYLDGPKDKLFYIFSDVSKNKRDYLIKVPKLKTKKINYLNNKSLAQVKLAQKNALIQSFKKAQIPFRELKIKSFNEETLGQLFSYFILETAITGKISNINPYDQPAVEQVKINTKKILK